MVSWTAGISVPPLRFQGPRVGCSAMVFVAAAETTLCSVQAARPRRPLDNPITSLVQALRKKSTSPSLVAGPRLTRMAPSARAVGTPIAARTGEADTLPDEQADPEETAIPARSRAIKAVSALAPGTANRVVFGTLSTF